jgi:anti-sigma factor RsiW
MNAPAIDDLTLHAWLDGELAPERRAEVEAWLQAHPEDAARVRLWAADRELIRTQLSGVLEEPVPPALVHLLRRGPAPPRAAFGAGWQRLAAALALLVLGGVIGAGLMWRLQAEPRSLARLGEPAWVARAAVAHAVYAPEVRHPVEVGAQEERHLAGWLTKRLDVPVTVFDLRAQGFELVGGRLLPDTAGPSAQLMYQQLVPAGASAAAAKPVRVTVYLRKPDRATPAAFRYEQQGALGMFYWIEGATPQGGACGYALVGPLPRAQLLALAEAIYQQGETPGR